ncbi:MAG: hypothetical protein AAFX78_14805 [Cyanobacteria bacterium J06638_20]
MILSRRKVHLGAFIALGILLPLVFLFGLWLCPVYPNAGDEVAPLFELLGALLVRW